MCAIAGTAVFPEDTDTGLNCHLATYVIKYPGQDQVRVTTLD